MRSPQVIEKAKQIQLLILDVDGVLTDGKLHFTATGEHFKSFHVHDGFGIKMLMQNHIDVAIITSRHSEIVIQRAKEVGIKKIYQGQENKLHAFTELLKQYKLEPHQTAYVGDDLPDLPLFQRVGLSIAVANANSHLKEYTDTITQIPGGQGAVREVCELILHAQDLLFNTIEKFLHYDQ